MPFPLRRVATLALMLVLGFFPEQSRGDHRAVHGRASSSDPASLASGAVDGDRFSFDASHAWSGQPGRSEWWWQLDFDSPTDVGCILQVVGDHEFVLRNAPSRYVWEGTRDGVRWFELARSSAEGDSRLYRIQRLKRSFPLRSIRIRIAGVSGDHPVLRELEFYSSTRAVVAFPEWVVAVNVTHDSRLPGHGQEFIPLAKSCSGSLQAQQVWLDRFNPEFIAAEPRPLCAFLSGSFKDWCEVDRSTWKGVERVLRSRRLAMWASCGGAQGLGILSEYGTAHAWDCPHCRDPKSPKTPLYGHIAHTGSRPCGDYSQCVFERGPHEVRKIGSDSAFDGLPESFTVMESHCGQLEWVPKGWDLVATAGTATSTKVQCIHLRGAPIYAAQFHIEMQGTPEVSKRIMGNFLEIARRPH